jgi:oligopeptide/dipeptide ABC transporter ATP-binding protein
MYAGRAAERGTVDALFAQCAHPYTRGLLESLPALGKDRLIPIPGSPPNMLQPPPGCAFAPRCSHAQPECTATIPELRPFGEGETACIRAEEIAREAAHVG